MQISRRGFIGGIVASATMAEAGALAEFMSWFQRKPTSVMAPGMGWPGYGAAEDAEVCSCATRMFLSRDGLNWRELKGIKSVDLRNRHIFDEISDFSSLVPLVIPRAKLGEITLKGDGFFNPLPDLLNLERFQLHLPGGGKIDGLLGITEVSQALQPSPAYSLRGTVVDPLQISFLG
jgi:hypothetical protein